MMEAFVSGESTSHEFIRQMNAEFWAAGLNEDDRFSDLLMALDLFGVPREDFGVDAKMLTSECQYALRILRDGFWSLTIRCRKPGGRIAYFARNRGPLPLLPKFRPRVPQVKPEGNPPEEIIRHAHDDGHPRARPIEYEN